MEREKRKLHGPRDLRPYVEYKLTAQALESVHPSLESAPPWSWVLAERPRQEFGDDPEEPFLVRMIACGGTNAPRMVSCSVPAGIQAFEVIEYDREQQERVPLAYERFYADDPGEGRLALMREKVATLEAAEMKAEGVAEFFRPAEITQMILTKALLRQTIVLTRVSYGVLLLLAVIALVLWR